MITFFVVTVGKDGKLAVTDQDTDFDELNDRYESLPDGTPAYVFELDQSDPENERSKKH
jgi:hypothetical protein